MDDDLMSAEIVEACGPEEIPDSRIMLEGMFEVGIVYQAWPYKLFEDFDPSVATL